MNRIFIDRNMSIKIKQHLDNGEKEISSIELKELIMQKDWSNNLISIFHSVKEGGKGYIENISEKKETIEKEADIISKFFKRAKVDSEFMLDNLDKMSKTLHEETELDWESNSKFLSEMNDILYQPIGKTKQKHIKDKIFEKANIYNIKLSHIVVVGSLSILYGCDKMRGVLKFKEKFNSKKPKHKNIYNSLNDILAIFKFNQIKALMLINNPTDTFEFVTFDKPLKFIIDNIHITPTLLDNNITRMNIIYDKKLFSKLTDDEYRNLMIEINQKEFKSL